MSERSKLKVKVPLTFLKVLSPSNRARDWTRGHWKFYDSVIDHNKNLSYLWISKCKVQDLIFWWNYDHFNFRNSQILFLSILESFGEQLDPLFRAKDLVLVHFCKNFFTVFQFLFIFFEIFWIETFLLFICRGDFFLLIKLLDHCYLF